MPSQRDILRTMCRSAYDLQELRIQMGLRLCANFRSKLSELGAEEQTDEEGELSEKAKKLIDLLKGSYTRLTDGVARNRKLPEREGFQGDELISDYTELVLVAQYMAVEGNERSQFSQLESVLQEIPIYTQYLKGVRGIGPAMATVLISYFDPYKARHISAFWAYAGLDVAADGRGRSKRTEHLVDRVYTKKDGTSAERKSVTYEPWLKARLMGVLAGSFLRSSSPWRAAYDGRRHRILSDPAREKVTLAEYKKRHKAGENTNQLWPPLRIHKDALRYMMKQFLRDFWVEWRTLEGLPVTEPYSVDKLGQRPHG